MATQTDPHAEYTRRLVLWQARIAVHDRRHEQLANIRLATFLAAIAIAVFIVRGSLSGWWLAPLVIFFVAVVLVHARVLERRELALRARALYERGLEKLAGRWIGAGRDGAAYGADHPYARDLDLFGRASLFERINTARTETGEETLASWLAAACDVDEVRARQRAVEELRGGLDFREDVAVLADEAQLGDTRRLLAWARSSPVSFLRLLPILLAACAGVTVLSLMAAYYDLIPWSLALGWLLVQGGVALSLQRRVHAVLHGLGTAERDLGLVAGLIGRIERQPFDAPWLLERQASLGQGGAAASAAIGRLRSVVSLVESFNHNVLFIPIARLLLLPEQCAVAISRWHAVHGPDVVTWLRVTGEVEALSALAAYAFERPRDPFPELSDAGAVFDAQALAHPLIDDATAVANDLRLGGDYPHLLVVSGSNMSGKSTLLRAAGVNVVLALAGAPVRAARLRLSRLVLGATLRVDDSLAEGRSRFYAEIVRIRAIVEIARRGTALLFLLDEILHGTNSHDRRIGAEAIVRDLVVHGAIGMITTHDLALTAVVESLGAGAANVHFEDQMDDGRLRFDYRMRPGVVEHSNALALMRAVGLDV